MQNLSIKCAVSEPKVKKKRGGTVCCVTGCHSWKARDKIGFFKVKRKTNPSRTEAWTKAISRKNQDGSLWQPSDSTLICALHFVTGKPSDDPQNPDYIPSKFNTGHIKEKTELDVNRYKRALDRSAAKVISNK